MKKHLLFLILIFTINIISQAQSVSYSYRLLAAEGCTVSITPTFVGDTAYLIVSIQSDRLVFNENPTMMVRFFNTDQLLQLSGQKISTTTSSGGVMISNVFVPITEMKSMAMFKVTDQEIESFKLGVERIRLSTLPITHDRTFRNDKIGMELYHSYQKEKQKAKSF